VVDALSDVSILFAFALALALLIERFLEVVKSCYDVVDSRWDLYHFWSRRARAIQTRIEQRLGVFEYVSPDLASGVLNRMYQLLLNNQPGYTGTTLIVSGDLVRAAGVRLGCKVLGMLIGVTLALWLGIDFVQLWQPPGGIHVDSTILRTIASGIALGLGTGPVHKIITAIEKQRADKDHPTDGAQ
jgi:hypothetical protein